MSKKKLRRERIAVITQKASINGNENLNNKKGTIHLIDLLSKDE